MKLFAKKKPSAIVFVDFEYMQISFKKKFGVNPPVLDWHREASERFDIRDTYFFADFSNASIKYNLPELRKITGNIIETHNTGAHKKDFTDFFLLDTIYQKAFERNAAEYFIIFTGDGHFGGVTRFLMEKCGKKVVIYGIENTISGQLRAVATECIEYPSYSKLKKLYYPVIAKYISTLKEQSKAYITFLNTVRSLSEQLNLNQTYIHDALEGMIEDGYISLKEQWVSNRKRIKIMIIDWDKIKRDHLL